MLTQSYILRKDKECLDILCWKIKKKYITRFFNNTSFSVSSSRCVLCNLRFLFTVWHVGAIKIPTLSHLGTHINIPVWHYCKQLYCECQPVALSAHTGEQRALKQRALGKIMHCINIFNNASLSYINSRCKIGHEIFDLAVYFQRFPT